MMLAFYECQGQHCKLSDSWKPITTTAHLVSGRTLSSEFDVGVPSFRSVSKNKLILEFEKKINIYNINYFILKTETYIAALASSFIHLFLLF